jgi:uncharacterized protein (DUF58 family)
MALFVRLREFFRWFYRYRSIQLTSEGTRYVLLTLAVGVAAINTGNNLLYLLLAMLLSLIVMSGLLSEQCLKQLEIRRILPEQVFANQPTIAALAIANRKPRLPTFSMKMMDVVDGKAVDRGIHLLHLGPRASTFQSYPLLIPRRGLYAIEGIKLQTRFPFGLFVKAATFPLPSDIVVFPEVKPLPGDLVTELTALGHEQAAFRRGMGASLYNLRGYQAGDDSRAIHWKTSARQGRLVVKETEAEDQRRVTIALSTAVPDADRHDFEEAVSLAASLAVYFHERHYAVGLLAGETVLEPALGMERLHAILRTLALCRRTLASGSVPPGFQHLGNRTDQGELTLLILTWPDPALLEYRRAVSGVFQASEPA